jgi:2-keto-3-deoxy-6-phosphogluconate aldolase
MPGAFTPTEILTAWEAGADRVIVFNELINQQLLENGDYKTITDRAR